MPLILIIFDKLAICLPRFPTPVMVFEVLSPTTCRKDRIIKYQLYEQAGVKYYFIVDLETNSTDVFLLRKDKYGEFMVFKDDSMIFDLGPCRGEFDFSKVFIK
jgi:Uma2 family endonuclease